LKKSFNEKKLQGCHKARKNKQACQKWVIDFKNRQTRKKLTGLPIVDLSPRR
jgi:hypothetical protein